MTSTPDQDCIYDAFDKLIARPTFTAEELGLSTPAVFDAMCPECLAASPRTPRPAGTPAQQAVARLIDATRAASAVALATDPDSAMSRRFATERAWAHNQALRRAEDLAPTGELLLALTTDPDTETHLYTSRAGRARWALVRIADTLLERRHARHAPHGRFDPTPGDERWAEAYREIVASSAWPGPDRAHVFKTLADDGPRSGSRDHVAAELGSVAARLVPASRDVAVSARRVASVVVQMLVTRTGILPG